MCMEEKLNKVHLKKKMNLLKFKLKKKQTKFCT
jgi:hypothetical protein